ncbi:T9SS type A sorting domain-containing protein [Flavobacteriaceae bacterium LMO-SS05]
MKYLCFLIFLFPVYLISQTWQNTSIVPNSNGQRFDDVFFIDDQIGWAANGYYAKVFKTVDGGLNWVKQLDEADLGSNLYFRNIEFLNANIGFLGTLNGKFYKTIDGGDSWNLINNISTNPVAICGLDAVGSTTIYGCGAYFTPAFIIKSSDSGATWDYIDMSGYANALVEIYFLTETTGFASGRSTNGGCVLKTTDGGLTWTEIFNSNIAGEYVWKLQVLESNPNVMFGSIESVDPNLGKLIKSIDGGLTWNSYIAPETDIQAVGFIDENHGWMGGHTTGFYETLDGGQTWANLNIGSNLNRIFIINSTLAYASGTSIYKFTTESLSTNSVEEHDRKQLAIDITKNPVSSKLEFTVQLQASDNLLIELYDVNGKFIRQLSRTTMDSGIKKAFTFNVEDLASGTYILNFHNNTGRESRKFIKI